MSLSEHALDLSFLSLVPQPCLDGVPTDVLLLISSYLDVWEVGILASCNKSTCLALQERVNLIRKALTLLEAGTAAEGLKLLASQRLLSSSATSVARFLYHARTALSPRAVAAVLATGGGADRDVESRLARSKALTQRYVDQFELHDLSVAEALRTVLASCALPHATAAAHFMIRRIAVRYCECLREERHPRYQHGSSSSGGGGSGGGGSSPPKDKGARLGFRLDAEEKAQIIESMMQNARPGWVPPPSFASAASSAGSSRHEGAHEHEQEQEEGARTHTADSVHAAAVHGGSGSGSRSCPSDVFDLRALDAEQLFMVCMALLILDKDRTSTAIPQAQKMTAAEFTARNSGLPQLSQVPPAFWQACYAEVVAQRLLPADPDSARRILSGRGLRGLLSRAAALAPDADSVRQSADAVRTGMIRGVNWARTAGYDAATTAATAAERAAAVAGSATATASQAASQAAGRASQLARSVLQRAPQLSLPQVSLPLPPILLPSLLGRTLSARSGSSMSATAASGGAGGGGGAAREAVPTDADAAEGQESEHQEQDAAVAANTEAAAGFSDDEQGTSDSEAEEALARRI